MASHLATRQLQDLDFDGWHYVDGADVLYLSLGAERDRTVDADADEQGHGWELDRDGRVIALILVNVRWLFERNGELRVGVLDEPVTPEQLSPFMPD